LSIDLSVDKIQRANKRRKAGENYLDVDEVKKILAEAYIIAIKQASLEAFEGIYDPITLTKMVDREAILTQALVLIEPS
jgi:hypothetical protein